MFVRMMLIAVLGWWATSAVAATIPLMNPDFEQVEPGDPLMPGGFGAFNGSILGWTDPGNFQQAGTFAPNALAYPGGSSNVAFITNATITQSVGTIAADTSYTLSADIGNRLRASSPEGSVAGFFVGSTDGDSFLFPILSPEDGTFDRQEFTVSAEQLSDFVGQPLLIAFRADRPQLNLDNVVLEATQTVVPLPPAALLLGGALVALGLRQRLLPGRREDAPKRLTGSDRGA
ncbi:MAG: hypothetical protein AAF677_04575 [Pseudomonadota bacterium]